MHKHSWKFDRFPFVLLYEYHNRIACVAGTLEEKTLTHTQNNSRWNSQMNASTVEFSAGRNIQWNGMGANGEHIGETSGTVRC